MKLRWQCFGVTWKVTDEESDKSCFIDVLTWKDDLFGEIERRFNYAA